MSRVPSGNVTVLLLPTLGVFFFLTLLAIDLGRARYFSGKAQTVADATLLSSLRLRVEGLEAVAERWNAWGDVFTGGGAAGARTQSRHWARLENESDKLRRALSGYKGRIKAVVKIVAEANGVARDRVEIQNGGALELGLTSQDQWVEDETGARRRVRGLWYKREWDLGRTLGRPREFSAHRFTASFRIFGGRWSLSREAVGKLSWDVPMNDGVIRSRGNGGFPRAWTEALDRGAVAPHRYAHFEAGLTNGEVHDE